MNPIIKEEEEDNQFLQEIKFNIIFRETVSYIDENNNIPDSFCYNYYINNLLMTKGKE